MYVVVIAGTETSAAALSGLVAAIGDSADAIACVAPTPRGDGLRANANWFTVAPGAGFGRAVATGLSTWGGAAPVLLIRGDATCDDWKALLTQCRRCHAQIARLGVWSPRTLPSAWDLARIKPLSATMTAVAAVDSSVVSLTAAVAARLRDLGIPEEASADDVCAAMVAAAYARNLLVLRDELATVSSSVGDAPPAMARGECFSSQLLPAEQAHLEKLREFVAARRHRPAQRIVSVEVDAGLEGCSTSFEVLERMHTGQSEHHVPPPDSLGINLAGGVNLTAFYLPQFHRLAVNDRAWGRGFTEWTNVTRCQPFFRGHLQPHLPADLGFYDLANPEVLARQTRLALHYGVGAFCFHYYWFGGQVVMPTPLRLFRELDDPNMRFCLCWANENWTKRWDGRESEIILKQPHTYEIDRRLIEELLPLLRSRHYLRANGAAVLVIYRPTLLGDDIERTVEHWRRVADAEGVGPLLILGSSFVENPPPPEPAGRALDGVVEFPPHGHFNKLVGLTEATFFRRDFDGSIHDYDDAVATFEQMTREVGLVVPGVFPSWDNSARLRGRAHIYVNSSPPKFRAWLAAALRRSLADPANDGLVFINAWNEWAEGAHLEPCRWYGHAHLAACSRAIDDVVGERGRLARE